MEYLLWQKCRWNQANTWLSSSSLIILWGIQHKSHSRKKWCQTDYVKTLVIPVCNSLLQKGESRCERHKCLKWKHTLPPSLPRPQWISDAEPWNCSWTVIPWYELSTYYANVLVVGIILYFGVDHDFWSELINKKLRNLHKSVGSYCQWYHVQEDCKPGYRQSPCSARDWHYEHRWDNNLQDIKNCFSFASLSRSLLTLCQIPLQQNAVK